MKLELGKRRVWRRGGEILRPVGEDQSERFDPRVELPGKETHRILNMIDRGEEPNSAIDQKKTEALVWLVAADPKFEKMFRQLEYFSQDFPLSAVEQWEATGEKLDQALGNLDVVLQVHPEYRDQVERFLKMENFYREALGFVKQVNELNTPAMRVSRLLKMIRLWPEKRGDLEEHFFPSAQRLVKIESQLDQLGSAEYFQQIMYAAACVLLFPELRQDVLAKVKTQFDRKAFSSQQMKELERSQTGFEMIQDFLFSMAVLHAPGAEIDGTGKMKIELPPAALRQRAPLPDRLEV